MGCTTPSPLGSATGLESGGVPDGVRRGQGTRTAGRSGAGGGGGGGGGGCGGSRGGRGGGGPRWARQTGAPDVPGLGPPPSVSDICASSFSYFSFYSLIYGIFYSSHCKKTMGFTKLSIRRSFRDIISFIIIIQEHFSTL